MWPKLAQVALLNELGLKTVGPDDEDSAYWGELSCAQYAAWLTEVERGAAPAKRSPAESIGPLLWASSSLRS